MIDGFVPAGRFAGWCVGIVAALLCWGWLGAGVAGAEVTATATFASPGQYTFTVPAGVTSVAVSAIGAAGGGAALAGLAGRGRL